MNYRVLGKTGESASLVSLGCMRFPDEETAVDIMQRSLLHGITYYETSENYCGGNSEVWLGRGLGARRDTVLVSTKSRVGTGDQQQTEDEVRRRIEVSLGKLGTDYLDFYQCWSIKLS